MSDFVCKKCGNKRDFKIELNYRYASGVIDSHVTCLQCGEHGPAMIWPTFVEYPMFEREEAEQKQ